MSQKITSFVCLNSTNQEASPIRTEAFTDLKKALSQLGIEDAQRLTGMDRKLARAKLYLLLRGIYTIYGGEFSYLNSSKEIRWGDHNNNAKAAMNILNRIDGFLETTDGPLA